jgi:hypothetical protein
MKLDGLRKRLDALEPEGCPRCRALAAIPDEEWHARIEEQVAGRRPVALNLPEAGGHF